MDNYFNTSPEFNGSEDLTNYNTLSNATIASASHGAMVSSIIGQT